MVEETTLSQWDVTDVSLKVFLKRPFRIFRINKKSVPKKGSYNKITEWLMSHQNPNYIFLCAVYEVLKKSTLPLLLCGNVVMYIFLTKVWNASVKMRIPGPHRTWWDVGDGFKNGWVWCQRCQQMVLPWPSHWFWHCNACLFRGIHKLRWKARGMRLAKFPNYYGI